MSGHVTVIGFGGRSPPEVVSLVSDLRKQNVVKTISAVRSPALPQSLLSEGCFLGSVPPPPHSSSSSPTLVLYAVPSSISDYIAHVDESNAIRSTVLSQSSAATNTHVVGFSNSEFLGGVTSSDIIIAMTSSGTPTLPPTVPSSLLTALNSLETRSASTLFSTPKDTVAVVGSGGREHALAVALSLSPRVGRVICCPGNGGTARESAVTGSTTKIENAPDCKSHADIIALTSREGVKMVVVGPEQPLVDGLANELNEACPDVLVFGPSRDAAVLEASKAYTKDFLREFGIPTSDYRNFTSASDAKAYISSLPDDHKVVVKASGIAAGKGVLIPETRAAALDAVDEIMSDRAFGAAGDTCVVEDFITGPEASCLALCDGVTAKLLPAAQDHKRALDGDLGLNTGGMGAYAPAPVVTSHLQKEIEAMCQKVVEKMRVERGIEYVGVLYAGMMLTESGPSVLEFNCRFGDPETQVLLPLMESDLYEVFEACCTKSLDKIDIRFKENTCAATVVCAAMGYPSKYPKGMTITGLDSAGDSVKVYHAGTKLEGDVVKCSGGRVLAVTGLGNDLKSALGNSYATVKKLDFVSDDGQSLMHYRTDIAHRAIKSKLRLGVMGSTRGSALVPVLEAIANNQLHAEVVCILSNRSKALILDKAPKACKSVFVSAKNKTRAEYDAECTAVLESHGVDYLLLIGYMRILSAEFCEYWKGKCVNVHPSLLPKFAGGMDLEVHKAAIDAKETESGCTIHLVTEEVDGGPILVQKKVAIDKDETPETLKAKIQPLEGLAFIEAISAHIAKTSKLTYADAGVSIVAGNDLVTAIKPYCKATARPGCDADLGGFGGLFDLAAAGYSSDETIIIGATDGVGTKLRVAQIYGKHDTIGEDLVAMCVNDLIVTGGEPLFFLDYYATGALTVSEAASVVRGIARGCELARCGLIGGETAEMPDIYAKGDYDLAGFAVGAVRKGSILPKDVGEGDVLLGLASSGVHSNGYSLVRKLVAREEGLEYDSVAPWDETKTVGESLLTPTKIYVKSCMKLIQQKLVHGFAHITGGGLIENLPRSLPSGVNAEITHHPTLPPVFQWIKRTANLEDRDMLLTFNCGVGMVVIVPRENVSTAKSLLESEGETVCEMGVLVGGSGDRVVMKTELS
mmetsp:Transcript_41678/g.50726  ORF Transcript_41678/g.50726 Transcript_41678/m.50726 type:complete len:1143 (+) Transcript_41678:82-3510(+)|eukprot:CAMPEP_0172517206 /NCGR_PEP_ID=MMETSP1066-20121228/282904_1 /TAXON_ID=671091 /ORGANISM="Coscinodiscus wailesii, Strain CCMP2513" /LENGTH=1142 /DNA_ID=CAMNT_0013299075 /DNA_START=72 /DNA_END=3500 /DNA_ORIENTATION=+